jgi:hypothetical protein
MANTKKNQKKSKGSQYTFRRVEYRFYQYWIIYYTERYQGGLEKDFATFIKAKSYDLAKTILHLKLKEDLNIKPRAIQGFMLHKGYRNSHNFKKLSLSDWADVKNASFPNLNNFLFKKEMPRPEGYNSRFNQSNPHQIKKIGFKKGKDNWAVKHRTGVARKFNERKGLKWNGDKWAKWNKDEMRKTKNMIINALILFDNNRTLAANHLNMSRGKLYKLMARCETKEWWKESYPPQKPIPPRVSSSQRSQTQKRVMQDLKSQGHVFFKKNKTCEAKRLKNLRATILKKQIDSQKLLIPKIRKALKSNDNNRTLAAQSLGVKIGTFRSWMDRSKHLVNWTKEYPTNYNRNEK